MPVSPRNRRRHCRKSMVCLMRQWLNSRYSRRPLNCLRFLMKRKAKPPGKAKRACPTSMSLHFFLHLIRWVKRPVSANPMPAPTVQWAAKRVLKAAAMPRAKRAVKRAVLVTPRTV